MIDLSAPAPCSLGVLLGLVLAAFLAGFFSWLGWLAFDDWRWTRSAPRRWIDEAISDATSTLRRRHETRETTPLPRRRA